MNRPALAVSLAALTLAHACSDGGGDSDATVATTGAAPSTGATTDAPTSTTVTTGLPSTGVDVPGTTTGTVDTGTVDTGTVDTGTVDMTTGTTGPADTDTNGCGDTPTGGMIVSTSYGPVEGVVDGDALAFLGVRYAGAPVGDYRLLAPSFPTCVPEVTPAKTFGPVCPQLVKNKQGEVTDVIGDEDCLFLNVWTPATGPGDRPVMVFVHGGGNSVGSGSDELYNGAGLAAAQDVVVITINYRLGALGWLTNWALADVNGGASGNYGLLDIRFTLDWVKRNVDEFGGDPERVLLFGESAGAVDTCALLHTKYSEGLFHRVIVQSGACRERTLQKYETETSVPWLNNSGCKGLGDPMLTRECLRAIPAHDFVQISPDGYPDVAALAQGWGPHVDKALVPTDGLTALAAGTHVHVPIIIGSNAAETAAAVPPLTEMQYESLVALTFGPLADQVLAKYPVADYDDPTAAYVALTSDAKFVCTARRAARAADMGQDDAPVRRYVFAYDGYTPLPGTEAAARHGLELVYLFGNFDAVLDGGVEYQPNAADLMMRDALQEMWANFARTGDPSTAALSWPLYGPADDHALLDVPLATGQGVRTAQCDFWDGLGG